MRVRNSDAPHFYSARNVHFYCIGIDLKELTNIDTVDAALCAYVAHLAATGAPLQAYGVEATGLIVVPFAPSGSV
jgi:predicted RNase H-like nuclease